MAGAAGFAFQGADGDEVVFGADIGPGEAVALGGADSGEGAQDTMQGDGGAAHGAGCAQEVTELGGLQCGDFLFADGALFDAAQGAAVGVDVAACLRPCAQAAELEQVVIPHAGG